MSTLPKPDPLLGWPATPELEEAYWNRIRPKRRLDCLPGGINGVRPCPWASCAEHMIHILPPELVNDPRFRIDLMSQSCVLDVADGLTTLEGEKQDGVPVQALGQIIFMRPKDIEELTTKALQKLGPRVPDLLREEELEDGSVESWQWTGKTLEEMGEAKEETTKPRKR